VKIKLALLFALLLMTTAAVNADSIVQFTITYIPLCQTRGSTVPALSFSFTLHG
jgi:hypothetical protein